MGGIHDTDDFPSWPKTIIRGTYHQGILFFFFSKKSICWPSIVPLRQAKTPFFFHFLCEGYQRQVYLGTYEGYLLLIIATILLLNHSLLNMHFDTRYIHIYNST